MNFLTRSRQFPGQHTWEERERQRVQRETAEALEKEKGKKILPKDTRMPPFFFSFRRLVRPNGRWRPKRE